MDFLSMGGGKSIMPMIEKNHENSRGMGKGWKTIAGAFIGQNLCSFFSKSSSAAMNTTEPSSFSEGNFPRIPWSYLNWVPTVQIV